jgi:hypothetical protein
MLNRRRFVASAAASAGLMPASRALGQASSPTIVPLSEQRSRFLLEVGVDGSGGYRFVLDTGASAHFISTRLVRDLRLPRLEERMVRGHDGQSRDTVVGIARFNVGGVEMGRSRAIAWAPERLDDHDGLIGYPFLYPRATLALGAGRISLGEPDPAVALTPVRAEVARNQALLLGGIEGADGRFVMDTGVQACTVSDTYHARIRETVAYKGATQLVYRDGQGALQVTAFRPAEMRFGDFAIPNPVVRIGQAADRDGLFHGVDGLAGVNLLRPYTWALDQMAGKLTAGGGPPPAPLAEEGTGLRLARDGTVTGIALGSPAEEAGVRPGAKVVALVREPGLQRLLIGDDSILELPVRALL